VADLLDLLLFCEEEQKLGNQNQELVNVISNCYSYLNLSKLGKDFTSLTIFLKEYKVG